MMTPGALDDVLEKLVDAIGDPVDPIYEELFAAWPDLRVHFVLDDNKSVRGNMLGETLNLLRDLASGDSYATNFLRAEYQTHQGYGVPAEAFPAFLDAIEQVVRTTLDDEWDAADRSAFSGLLARARDIIATPSTVV